MKSSAALCLLLIAACSEKAQGIAEHAPMVRNDTAEQVQAPTADKLTLLKRFECDRCHIGTGLPELPLNKQCVGCHQEILKGTAPIDKESMALWSKGIHSLPVAPSLAAVGMKFNRDWVRKQLLEPQDLRPHLQATMPRLRISEQEAEALALALVPSPAANEVFSRSDIQTGKALYENIGCNSCHAFGEAVAQPRSIPILGEPGRDALLLAPDLLHARARYQSGSLVRWLMAPESVDPSTAMPNFGLSRKQAQSLAAYIWYSDAKAPSPPSLPKRLPVLARQVGWDEVFEKVFETVCWHCHSASDLARGDGGVGNTGGFGFPARGLDLSSYEAIRSGSIGPDGRRRSIFVKDDEGRSLLLRHILARQQEVRGRHDERLLGMPLGFPPLSVVQIQLVESWIAQGRPR